MSGIGWQLRRLRAMEGPEILHRTREFFSKIVEGRKIAKGWKPSNVETVRPRMTLFPAGIDTMEGIEALPLDEEALAMLVSGHIDFFGHEPLSIGNPVQWHRDPLTGTEAPPEAYGKSINYRDDSAVGNIKFLWELGRHQHLVPVAAAYAVTGDVLYKKAVVDQIDGWIKANPFGLGIHWCNALEVALRLISWSVIHSLIALREGESGLFRSVDNAEALGNSIYQQTWFVANFFSRYSSANNHLIGELTGVWTVTQAFDMGSVGEKWARQAQSELEDEAIRQVFADGVDKEQAIYYHLWVLEYFLFASLVGKRANKPFSDRFQGVIREMARFLRDITPDGGEPPQIGDADNGFVVRFNPRWPSSPYADVLEAEAALRGRACAGSMSQKAFWFALAAGTEENKTAAGDIPEPGSSFPRVYPDGGYVVMGDDTCRIVFDSGSLGYPSIAAHGHSDALSFCLAVGKDWWIVDPGTYAYHSMPEWRKYFRGTSAHSTLMVDGENQSRDGGPFLWSRHARAVLEGSGHEGISIQWAEGHHDGYKHLGVSHTRKIVYNAEEKRLYVHDRITGRGEHGLSFYLHFHPDIFLQEDDTLHCWWAWKKERKSKLKITSNNDLRWGYYKGNEEPLLGWYSSSLDVKQPAATLKGCMNCTLPAEVLTVISIVRGEEPVNEN